MAQGWRRRGWVGGGEGNPFRKIAVDNTGALTLVSAGDLFVKGEKIVWKGG